MGVASQAYLAGAGLLFRKRELGKYSVFLPFKLLLQGEKSSPESWRGGGGKQGVPGGEKEGGGRFWLVEAVPAAAVLVPFPLCHPWHGAVAEKADPETRDRGGNGFLLSLFFPNETFICSLFTGKEDISRQ